MNYGEVKELIRLIDSSDINDFELKLDNAFLRISKNGKTPPERGAADNSAGLLQQHEKKADRNTAVSGLYDESAGSSSISASADEADGADAVKGHIIRSPIVATYYESAGPDKAPFVKLGGKVKKGGVLCILEAMKIMNEITSDTDGEIAEIYLKNGEMAEYNSPLFRII